MRGKIWSPGRPPTARREDRAGFWEAIRRGLSSEDAAGVAGVSQAVGSRWFREAGGMPPQSLAPVSGRYLSFSEREEIALLRAQKLGVREIARRVGRDPSTISREVRRNASTRSDELTYRASTAQWHAERRASRPKVAKLAGNDRLREYVQERLSGVICRPAGQPVAGPATRFIGRRHGLARVGGGRVRGALSRSRIAYQSISRMMSRCDLARGDLPGAFHSGPRRAAAGAGRVPEDRAGAAGTQGTHPGARQAVRHARGHDRIPTR